MPRVARKTQTPTEDQSSAIKALEDKLAEANAKLASYRHVAPVVASNMVDAGDYQIGPGDCTVTMSPEGSPQLVQPSIAVETKPLHPDKAEALRFMEESVEVYIPESADPKEGLCFSTWNDGRHQLFIRGRNITCKRKYVEVLARSKPIIIGNREYKDENNQQRFEYPKRTGLRYPFSVVRDDNPRGKEWLRKILMEP